jgi:hypothetical protein
MRLAWAVFESWELFICNLQGDSAMRLANCNYRAIDAFGLQNANRVDERCKLRVDAGKTLLCLVTTFSKSRLRQNQRRMARR